MLLTGTSYSHATYFGAGLMSKGLNNCRSRSGLNPPPPSSKYNWFFLAKITVVATLLCGLIIIPLHLTVVSATSNPVIADDTQDYRIYEGLAPTMEPWENGMRTNPMPGTFARSV